MPACRSGSSPVLRPPSFPLHGSFGSTPNSRPPSASMPDGSPAPRGSRSCPDDELAEGSEPIALAYAGHQFGNFVPQLGDGRAILLGEVVAPDGGGATSSSRAPGAPPSRAAATVAPPSGPVLREYVVSEAMAALGIPTTRALAAVDDRRAGGPRGPPAGRGPHPRRRRATSASARSNTSPHASDAEALRLLADYVIARHYPEAASAERPYRALLDGDRRRASGPHCPLAAGRLHPWRDEHRQHVGGGRDHRLWSVRLPRRLRSGQGLQLDRPHGSLRLRRAAADRAVESGAPGRNPAAAAFIRPGCRHPRRARGARRLPAEVRGDLPVGFAAQAWPCDPHKKATSNSRT